MANEYINKVVYGGNTLIDLTGDTVTAADVQSGKIFHLKDGSTTTGTNTWDSNTQDATAVAAEILYGKTAYVNKNKITGSMPNIGVQTDSITSKSQQITISQGYHDGSGKINIDPTEQEKLIGSNIKNGVTILGVLGTLTGEEMVSVTTKTVTPTVTAQTYTPPNGYDYFSEFTVNAIPYIETDNAQGGKTVTIAGS